MTIFLPYFGRSLTLLRDIERKRESRSGLSRFRFRRTEGAAFLMRQRAACPRSVAPRPVLAHQLV
jgi:hypothetical protein